MSGIDKTVSFLDEKGDRRKVKKKKKRWKLFKR
jgi:hypothetical protein